MIKVNLKPLYSKLLAIIAISCLGIVVYSNTFHCSFHFDDPFYLNDHNLHISNFQNLFKYWGFYPCRFITFLSFALNYHFNGLNVFWYHVFNLAVHLASAILVWWLVLLTLSTPAMKGNTITRHAGLIALFAGLVFVSHPLQTEAVSYIWQRTASMAAMFYLASLCLYVKSRLTGGHEVRLTGGHKVRPYYVFSLVLAVMAMLTKENTITLPLMILLYEFSFFNMDSRFRGNDIKRLSPFLITLFIIPLAIFFSKSAQEGLLPDHISPMHYILTQLRVMVTYIRLTFLPFNQNIDYDYPIFKNFFELPVIFSFLFLTSILYFAKHLFSKYRLISFSIFWFFLTLLPESSFIPFKEIMVEHRLYLPLAGFSIFLVSGVFYGTGRWGKDDLRSFEATCACPVRGPSLRMTVIILSLIVAFNSILTYQRNKVWANEFTLWDDTVKKSPWKSRPLMNRGSFYNNHGKLNAALLDYTKAITLDPGSVNGYIRRAAIYLEQGKYAQTVSDLNKAIEISPGNAIYYFNRGYTYSKLKSNSQAIRDFTKAIALFPKYAEAYFRRGLDFIDQGNKFQAMSDFNQTIEIDPHNVKAYNNRGNIYSQQGDFLKALSDYNKAIELDPDDAQAYINRGNTYSQQGHLPQALLDYNTAIAIKPNYVEAYSNRAVVHYLLKEYDKAWSDVDQAQALRGRINPDFVNALKNASGKDK